MTRFLVVVMEPPGYQHTGTIAEVAETLVCALRALGHPARLAVNSFMPDAVNIVLAAHFLSPALIPTLPATTVIYNLEQVEDSLFEWAPVLKELFARFEIWDYSTQNIERLKSFGYKNVFHLPIGMVPELTRIKPIVPYDFDILFYGVVNERRRAVLLKLAEAGLKMKIVFGTYGEARDDLIARSKLVLNLHKHDAKVFEIVRVSYLLANRKAVVSEIAPNTAIDPDLVDAVAGAPLDSLVETCTALVEDDDARKRLEERGYARMAARDETAFLRDLFSRRKKMKPVRPSRR